MMKDFKLYESIFELLLKDDVHNRWCSLTCYGRHPTILWMTIYLSYFLNQTKPISKLYLR